MDASLRRVHAFQRLFDTALGNGSQQACFASLVSHPVILIAEAQGRLFHGFGHARRSRRVLVQIISNILAVRQLADAVLSHSCQQRRDEFVATDGSAFQQ